MLVRGRYAINAVKKPHTKEYEEIKNVRH